MLILLGLISCRPGKRAESLPPESREIVISHRTILDVNEVYKATLSTRPAEREEFGLTGFHGSSEDGLSDRDSLMHAVRVFRGAAEVFVPVSSFRDLSNVMHAEFVQKAENTILKLEGGDASSSFTAELTFKGDVLRSRKVIVTAFPDEAFEETNYSNVEDRGQ